MTNLGGVEDKLGPARQALRYDHEVSQGWAVVDDVAVAVGNNRILGATAHDVDAILVDRKPKVLRQCLRVCLLREQEELVKRGVWIG